MRTRRASRVFRPTVDGLPPRLVLSVYAPPPPTPFDYTSVPEDPEPTTPPPTLTSPPTDPLATTTPTTTC